MKTKKFILKTKDKQALSFTKPMECPKCSAFVNPTLKNYSSIKDKIYLIEFENECCDSPMYCVYDFSRSVIEDRLLSIYPTPPIDDIDLPDNITSLFPRFKDIYIQACIAEYTGCIDLAAMGFRKSLEILIKDYAIKELNEPESVVNNKKLMDCISEYLCEQELVSTADVIRILGNDYSHYQQKYPQYDLEVLKSYMDILIYQIHTKLLIAHPPVKRK